MDKKGISQNQSFSTNIVKSEEQVENMETMARAQKKIEEERQEILRQEQVRLDKLEQEKRELQIKREEIKKQEQKSTLKRAESLKATKSEQEGRAFTSVKLGYVNSKKSFLLDRGSSMEPPENTTDSPARRRKNVWFGKSQETVRTRVPSPLPDNIKTGDVAAGVAGWSHRVAEMDKQASAMSPSLSRKVTTMKFGKAASESRSGSETRSVKSPTPKSTNQWRQQDSADQRITKVSPPRGASVISQGAEYSSQRFESGASYSHQQTFVGHQSSTGSMIWRPQDQNLDTNSPAA